jgi:hypothetical protein
VCFLPLHTRLRVQRAPGIPCALCLSEGSYNNSDALRREEAEPCHVIASEAKQSNFGAAN